MHCDAEAAPVVTVVLSAPQEVQLVWLSAAWYVPKAQSTHCLVVSSQYVPGVHVTEIYAWLICSLGTCFIRAKLKPFRNPVCFARFSYIKSGSGNIAWCILKFADRSDNFNVGLPTQLKLEYGWVTACNSIIWMLSFPLISMLIWLISVGKRDPQKWILLMLSGFNFFT